MTDADTNLSNLTTLWLLLGAYMVFLMQAGFALLEAGSVRAKNTKNILIKNLMDGCLGALVWYFIGYHLAYGTKDSCKGGSDCNGFVGNGADVFMNKAAELAPLGNAGSGHYYAGWMFQWAFAAAASTIVSGAVAERCKFGAYLAYTAALTGVIYPVVVNWGWSAHGWLSPWTGTEPYLGANGMIDFAGSGIVHMTGGVAALVGAIFLGPRTGRFSPSGECIDMPGHSSVLVALGTFILWFGWYGFNPVSTLAFEYMETAARVAVTTTLGAAAGGVTALSIHYGFTKSLDVGPMCNGILAGLVSITGNCVVIEPWAAALIGAIGAAIYYGFSALLRKLKIDDPLDASSVHGACGAWGVIAAGLFAKQKYVLNDYGAEGGADDYGALYGGGGKQLGNQIAGVVAIIAWVGFTSSVLFGVLKYAGMLRVPVEEEEVGLDTSHHGGNAYNFEKELDSKA
jgi:Amt family ammonium transporter